MPLPRLRVLDPAMGAFVLDPGLGAASLRPMHDSWVPSAFALAFALSVGGVASCGGRQPHATNPLAAASASASLSFSPSSGSSPLDAEFAAGACTVNMGASPGSTYQFAPTERQNAVDALRGVVLACLQRPTGVQGTVYLSAQVDATGQVTEPVASPGGALASDAATCLSDRLARLRLPAPTAAPASLLVLVVSACQR